jgi:hypothetical protein
VTRWIHRWWDVISNHDTEPIQLSLIALLTGWGVLFLALENGFAAMPSMVLLARYVGDDVWATFALMLAILWGYGFFTRRRRVTRYCAFISAMFWAIVATSAVYSSTATYAWIAFTVFTLQSGWVFLRGGGQWTQP